MLFNNKIYYLCVTVFFSFYSFFLHSNNIEKIQIIKDNYSIENLTLVDYKNKSTLLKDKKSSYYIINFWASWCAPCVKEMNSLNSLQKKAPYLRVITISQDKTIQISEEFFKKYNYNDLEKYFDKKKKILSKFKLRGLPTTFIANKNYKIFAKVEGIIEWDSPEFIKWLNNN